MAVIVENEVTAEPVGEQLGCFVCNAGNAGGKPKLMRSACTSYH